LFDLTNITLGILFITTIYHLFIFTFMKHKRELLYLGLLSIRSIFSVFFMDFNILQNYKSLSINFIVTSILLILFFKHLYKEEFENKYIKPISNGIIYFDITFLLFVMFLPLNLTPLYISIIETIDNLISVITIVLISILSVRATINRRTGSLFILCGFLFVSSTIISKYLFQDVIVSNSNNVGILGMVVSYFAALTKRHGLAYQKSESLIVLQSNQLLEQTNRELAEKNKHKEFIIKETHHRIKNNFATIVNLLTLQSNSLKNPEAIAALNDAIGRVNSMHVLYEKLLLTDDYETTSIKTYLDNLIDDLLEFFSKDIDIQVEREIDDFQIDSKLLFPIGLIINELFTNIMKYAFPNRISGFIEVLLKENNGEVILTVKDDGIGYPEGFDFDESNGFGMMLIKVLIKQLDGNIKVDNTSGVKTIIKISI
jgi:two-component sensor histidine kinase